MIRPYRHLTILILGLVLAACDGESAGPVATPTSTPTPTSTSVPAAALPDLPPATELELPADFTAYVVATGLIQPTSVALGPEGKIYVSQREGPVFRLEDVDGDGFFEETIAVTSGAGGQGLQWDHVLDGWCSERAFH